MSAWGPRNIFGTATVDPLDALAQYAAEIEAQTMRDTAASKRREMASALKNTTDAAALRDATANVSYMQFPEEMAPPQGDGSEVRNYDPSWRDRLAGWTVDAMTPVAGQESAKHIAEGLWGGKGVGMSNPTGMGLVDVVPNPVGPALWLNEAERSKQAQSGGLGSGMLDTIASVPIPGTAMGAKALKKVAGKADDAAKRGVRVENKVAGSGFTSEDFEINPQRMSEYRSPAMLWEGEVYEGGLGDNHATIAERYGFPKEMKPGFVTKDGVFHYQFDEDIPDQALMAAALRNEKPEGIRVYHGSPHDYAAERLVRMPDGSQQYIVGAPDVLPDVPQGATVLKDYPLGRARLDKIGTGEGAQAYGHGWYSGEAEGVAREYKNALGSRGVAFNGDEFENTWRDELSRRINIYAKENGIHPQTAKIYQRRIEAAIDESSFNNRSPIENLKELHKQDIERLKRIGTPEQHIKYQEVGHKKDIEIMKQINPEPFKRGKMYEARLNASPDEFLDWDKPLSEQPEGVRKVLADNWWAHPEAHKNQTGAAILDSLVSEMHFAGKGESGGGNAKGAATDALRAAGIKGIRYLDQGSRGVPPPRIEKVGDGFAVYWKNDPRPVDTFPTREAAEAAAKEIDTTTYNYVVFDDKIIDILRKYGIAGLSMLGGGAALSASGGEAQAAPNKDLMARALQGN